MAAVTATVAAAGATAYAANRSSKAQKNATNAATAAAERADDLGREQLGMERERFDWNRGIYERDIAPAARENQALQRRLAEDALAASGEQRQFARDQRDYYDRTFKPVEERVAREAMDYDSDGNVQRRSGMAAANVNQQFSNAQAQLARNLGRFGLNPNSGAFARQANNTALAQAAASAGAQTGAAFDTMDRGIALRSGVANFGRSMPNTAANFYAGGNQSGQVAGNASGSAAGAMVPAASFMNNAYNNMGNSLGIAGSSAMRSGQMMSNALGQQANNWMGVAQGLGGMTGALWNQAGGWGGISSALGIGGGWGQSPTGLNVLRGDGRG